MCFYMCVDVCGCVCVRVCLHVCQSVRVGSGLESQGWAWGVHVCSCEHSWSEYVHNVYMYYELYYERTYVSRVSKG